MRSGRVAIVGAGHAGGSVAALLRHYGWTGPIMLIGEEPIAPYQHSPLSKAWITGEADAGSLLLRPARFYAANDIGLRLGSRVIGIDRSAALITLGTGETLTYDRLILALGVRARRLALPGSNFPGVLELRSIADADRLKAALAPGRRLTVIGGGYIGLEAATSARTLGAEVTVIEQQARLLARTACVALSDFFRDYHRARAVRIELGARIEALEGHRGRLYGVRLADGRLIRCEVVLIGVGAVPNQELAGDIGLACNDGVLVDSSARNSDPTIYAIGDCTRRPVPLYGRMARLESVPNALEQARQAAADLCGRKPPTPEVLWFWSDQYDLRLQIAGLMFDAVETVLRGDLVAGSFALFHLAEDGRMRAVEAVNAAAEFMAGRLMIARGRRTTRGRLQDLSLSMQDLAA